MQRRTSNRSQLHDHTCSKLRRQKQPIGGPVTRAESHHTALYICYQSVREPLTQTQVIAYLQGLAAAGHRILLLTFEPDPPGREERAAITQQLEAQGIQQWHFLRYHKRPTLLATTWDILNGVWLALRLVRRQKVTLIHARAHVPGLMGLLLKKMTGVKLLFDLRGLMAEEYVDGGVWPRDGILFRMTKCVERILLQRSDAIVILTNAARDKLRELIPKDTEVQIIPCCVDCNEFQSEHISEETTAENPPHMLYVGKMGGWYPTGRMVDFFLAARDVIPDLRWRILTQHADEQLLRLLKRHHIEACVDVGSVPPSELPQAMKGAIFALCMYDRELSAAACSPTKIGEYLASGIPVIATSGVGDVEALLEGGESCDTVGIVLHESTPTAYRAAVQRLVEMQTNPNIERACRSAAGNQLDLRTVGWERYRHLYLKLIA